MPVYCPICGHAMDESLEFTSEVGWCEHCRGAFRGRPRAIPAWILGVVVIMGQATSLAA